MTEQEFYTLMMEVRELLSIAESNLDLVRQIDFHAPAERKAINSVRRLLRLVRQKLIGLEPNVWDTASISAGVGDMILARYRKNDLAIGAAKAQLTSTGYTEYQADLLLEAVGLQMVKDNERKASNL